MRQCNDIYMAAANVNCNINRSILRILLVSLVSVGPCHGHGNCSSKRTSFQLPSSHICMVRLVHHHWHTRPTTVVCLVHQSTHTLLIMPLISLLLACSTCMCPSTERPPRTPPRLLPFFSSLASAQTTLRRESRQRAKSSTQSLSTTHMTAHIRMQASPCILQCVPVLCVRVCLPGVLSIILYCTVLHCHTLNYPTTSVITPSSTHILILTMCSTHC